MNALKADTKDRVPSKSSRGPIKMPKMPIKTGGRGKAPRLVISGPVGPVKNSRGADLVRSERLTVVDGIKDCPSDSSSSSTITLEAANMTRRLSAGFNKGQPAAGSPTVAKSDVNATTTIKAAPKQTPISQLRKASLGTSFRKPNFQTTSTTTLLPTLNSLNQNENSPPLQSVEKVPPPRLASKLPKSRTMSVLHDLKSSMSRPSLASRSINSDLPTVSSQKKKNRSVSNLAAMGQYASSSAASSRLRLPRTSSTSLAQSSRSSSPEALPHLISTAQPSAYWTGRFVALHDRFASESLTSDSLSSLASSQSYSSYSQLPSMARDVRNMADSRLNNLSRSTTTMALTTMTYSPATAVLSPEDASCFRVFQHLESLCITTEAHCSLHDWQQAFARRYGRPALLPRGGSMEDRGFMSRFFGNTGSKQRERRSLSVLREAADDQARKRAVFGDTPVSRGKRLSVY